MNHITVHGKVTKKAEMKLLNINGEPVPVAIFTVVDIGLPYQQVEPTYFFVNYPKEAASLIAEYLVENKEILIHGTMRQKFAKDKDGNKVPRYYLRADMVELLPVFTQVSPTKKDAEHE
ncbi:MAG: single-stranded DNA-binding protein [Treponema sp.]|uniref:single-stranded DNA-binding protein n=1 Tax=Treponema sp. TaxID=166 RepID=UPI0025E0C3BA|nr:single-stranded DNA-binding protein [Treponema sp.]MBQ8680333.1 single-stranded DNA-binding protein [Treponema sp.]